MRDHLVVAQHHKDNFLLAFFLEKEGSGWKASDFVFFLALRGLLTSTINKLVFAKRYTF